LNKYSLEFNNHEVTNPEFNRIADIDILKLNLNFCSIRSLTKLQNNVDVDLFVKISAIQEKVELKDKKIELQTIRVIDRKKIILEITFFNDMVKI